MKKILGRVMILFVAFGLLTSCSQAPSLSDKASDIKTIVNEKLGTNPNFKGCIVEDSLETINVVLQYHYAYDHSGWGQLITSWLSYHYVKKRVFNDVSKMDFFYSILYLDMEGSNTKALFIATNKPVVSFYFDYPIYVEIAEYVVSKMTPSDFQAYDYAFGKLLKKYNDPVFKITFDEFLSKISSGEIDSYSASLALDKLIIWTEERGDIEKPDHFIFLKSLLDQYNEELEIIVDKNEYTEPS